MRQLSMAILMVSLIGGSVTAAMGASATHLPLSSPTLQSSAPLASANTVSTARNEKDKTLKQKATKASKKKAKKKAIHNAEKTALRSL
ncbi:TPA: hypothetical protein ACKP12_004127 [Serratia marcescens]|uniref:hypothetical protein n=1 Tax=Serratia TaxID=613 RepID=UPI00128C7E9A|nr:MULTISPECIES: hypothetical protein [Serratia]MBH2927910.1 hypothetical protein [Serratia ureilytica]